MRDPFERALHPSTTGQTWIRLSGRRAGGARAVSETSGENQERNRKIAENESARQVVGDVRVSVWAIAIAVVAALAAVAWVLIRSH